MQMMKVEGLTRENVASHLQKYRLSLKKTTDTDGKASAASVSEDNAADGTADGSGSGKGGQEGGSGAATSSAAAEGRGSGGGTVIDGSNSGGGDGTGSTEEGGTSAHKDKGVVNEVVPTARKADADPSADGMVMMQRAYGNALGADAVDEAAGVSAGDAADASDMDGDR
jgi:hypothetical protein